MDYSRSMKCGCQLMMLPFIVLILIPTAKSIDLGKFFCGLYLEFFKFKFFHSFFHISGHQFQAFIVQLNVCTLWALLNNKKRAISVSGLYAN